MESVTMGDTEDTIGHNKTHHGYENGFKMRMQIFGKVA